MLAAARLGVALLLSTRHDTATPQLVDKWRGVVESLQSGSEHHEVYAFLCMETSQAAGRGAPSAAAAEAAEKLWRVGLGEDVHLNVSAGGKYPGQYHRLDECYQRALAFERATSVNFTHFFRARQEHKWYGVPPPLSKLERSGNGRDVVYVRAAAIMYAKPTAVPFNALADIHKTCLIPPGMNATRAAVQRAAMAAAGVEVCAVLDDQAALVPRTLADAYFTLTEHERRGRFAGGRADDAEDTSADDVRVRVCGAIIGAHPNRSIFEKFATGTTAIATPATTATTTKAAGGTVFSGAAQVVGGPSSRERERMRRLKVFKNGVTYHTESAPCHSEGCLTARVYARQVPFELSPFPMALEKHSSYIWTKNYRCMKSGPIGERCPPRMC
jgi:hypothetical protein